MGISGRIIKCAAALLTAFSLTTGTIHAETGFLTVNAAAEKTIPKTKEPNANVKPDTYDTNQYVTLTCSTRGARIFYTLDDSIPTLRSKEYTGPIRLKADPGETQYYTIRAFAVATGCEDSDIVEFEYCIDKPFEKEVIYMELYRAPSKTRYNKGDELDLAGGKIAVTYDDYTYDVLSLTKSMVSPFNSSTAGEKTVVINYKGFIDRFTVTVRESTGSGSGEIIYPNGDDIINDDNEDYRPTLDGTHAAGWSAIKKELSSKPKGETITIKLNGATEVPSTVVLAAYKQEHEMIFVDESGMSWSLDTTTLNVSSIPNLGLGIRTSALNISRVTMNSLGGSIARTMHINSDNKLKAALSLNVGIDNYGRFANLYKYDHEARVMTFVSTAKVDRLGDVSVTPDQSGDYVIALNDSTGLVGDLDDSMDYNLTDAILLLNMIVGLEYMDHEKTDVNEDAIINSYDAAEILRRIIF